jgi:hypothetical protein
MKMLVATGLEDLNLLFELSNLIEIKKDNCAGFLHSSAQHDEWSFGFTGCR